MNDTATFFPRHALYSNDFSLNLMIFVERVDNNATLIFKDLVTVLV